MVRVNRTFYAGRVSIEAMLRHPHAYSPRRVSRGARLLQPDRRVGVRLLATPVPEVDDEAGGAAPLWAGVLLLAAHTVVIGVAAVCLQQVHSVKCLRCRVAAVYVKVCLMFHVAPLTDRQSRVGKGPDV